MAGRHAAEHRRSPRACIGLPAATSVSAQALQHDGTREPGKTMVIRFKCYSKTTNSNYVGSYNRERGEGQQGR